MAGCFSGLVGLFLIGFGSFFILVQSPPEPTGSEAFSEEAPAEVAMSTSAFANLMLTDDGVVGFGFPDGWYISDEFGDTGALLADEAYNFLLYPVEDIDADTPTSVISITLPTTAFVADTRDNNLTLIELAEAARPENTLEFDLDPYPVPTPIIDPVYGTVLTAAVNGGVTSSTPYALDLLNYPAVAFDWFEGDRQMGILIIVELGDNVYGLVSMFDLEGTVDSFLASQIADSLVYNGLE